MISIPYEVQNPNEEHHLFWSSHGVKFEIEESKVHRYVHGPGRMIYIEARSQRDGSKKWVVAMDGFCLGKDGKYHHEPMSSSRTKDFLHNTRFDSRNQALEAMISYERDNEGKVIELIIE